MKKNILLFLVLGIMSTMVVQAGEEFCEALPEEAQEVTLPLFLEEETFGEGVEDFDPFLGEEAQAAEEALENPLFQEEFLCGQEVAENDSLFSSEFGEMAQEPETFAGDEQVGDTQTLEVGDFTYVIVDGNASISKYNGTDSAVTVPTSFSYGGTSYRVRKINNFAFENCNSIKTLTIPEGITSIGYGTFKNCTNMSDIYINTNLADCSSYNTVRGEKYLDGRYRNPAYSYTSPFYNVGANSDSLTVTFGGGATQVSAYLFATGALEGEGCYAHVTKVVLGENVESVNPYAFSSCYDLKELVIGEQVTVIGSAAFSNDYHLSSITWGESLREIWGWAFYNCDALTSLSLPEKVTTLGNFAFERCEGLTGIELPAALSRMDYGVFKNCTKVESITINGNIANHSGFNMEGGEKYIDGGYRNPAYSYTAPFYNVGANAQELVISFGPGVTRVPSCLFATASSYSDGLFCHVKKVCLSDTVTVVGSYAFYNCQELTTIEMGNGVTNIENDAFDGCTSLTDIQWSESLRELGSAAFYACSSLTQVVLPENVTTVWDRVFKYCESLVSVTLPASTTVLNKGVFQQCKKLSSLTINGNLGDHSAYNLDTSERYIDGGYRKPAYAYTSPFYNAGANADSFTVTFAEGVTYIPAYLFGTGGLQSDNTYAAITKVVIPSSVTAIGKGAFHACYRLAEVSYGSNKKNWEKVAVGENNDSLLGAEIAFASVPEIAAPKLMGATLSPNGVKVTWEAVQNALFYRVLRREDLSESWTTVQDTQYLEYLDTSAVSGTKYTYTVVAVGEKGAVSDITDSLSITFLAAPKINTAINENMGVFLSWDVVPGAVAYRVFKRTSQGKWKKLGDTKAVVFLDETVKGGSTYTYTVRCISEDGSAYTSAYYSKGKKQKFIAAPVLTSAKNTSAGVVTVKWKKSKGAEKYQILRKPVNGSWSVVGTTKGTKFKDKTAKKGNTYVYTVGCISSKGASTSGKNETGLTVTVKK